MQSGRRDAAVVFAVLRRAVQRVGNQLQLGVGFVSWEIDLWGRLRSLSDSALRNLEATDALQRFVQVGLVSRVAAGWLDLLEIDQALDQTPDRPRSRQTDLPMADWADGPGVAFAPASDPLPTPSFGLLDNEPEIVAEALPEAASLADVLAAARALAAGDADQAEALMRTHLEHITQHLQLERAPTGAQDLVSLFGAGGAG
mgnify:CR=1 FL=1